MFIFLRTEIPTSCCYVNLRTKPFFSSDTFLVKEEMTTHTRDFVQTMKIICFEFYFECVAFIDEDGLAEVKFVPRFLSEIDGIFDDRHS